MDSLTGLQTLLAIAIRRWWIVAATVLVAGGIASLWAVRLPDVYETRTRLLLVPRTSEQLTEGNPKPNPVVSSLSVDTLSSLAKANDLIDQISRSLKSPRSPLPAEALANMMNAQTEVAQRGNNSASSAPLPLLTMKVRGHDPELVKEIANQWATLFIKENIDLFATEAARSFEFIDAQYQESQRTLDAKVQEKLTYLQAKPLEALQTELAALTGKRTPAELRDGAPPRDRTGLYETFLSQLETKRASLEAAQARAKSLQESLKSVSPVRTIERSLPNDLLTELLRGNPTPKDPSSLSSLTLKDQVLNPAYAALEQDLAQAMAEVASITSEVRQLEKKTAQFQASIRTLESEVAEIQAHISAYDREITAQSTNIDRLSQSLLEARLAKAEQSSSIRVVEEAVLPQVPVGPSRYRLIVLSIAIALTLGVLLALLVQYAQSTVSKGKVLPRKDMPTVG